MSSRTGTTVRPGHAAWLLLPLVLLLTLPAAVQAQFSYTITNGTVTITGYSGPGGAVTIPSTVSGLPVTSIGNSVFRSQSSLTSITIPDGVVNIGDHAFDTCTGLTSVTIPNSVTNIESGAFFQCFSLTSITIPNGVTSIGDSAFERCFGLSSITIPNSVTSIGAHAFDACTSLTSVMIGNGITSIGTRAFGACTGLTNIVIPNSVTRIGSSAFAQCTGLTSIVIPDSVTSIADNAFAWCTSLTRIAIPSSVTSIESSAFANCTNLSAMTVDALNPSYSSVDGVLHDKSQTTLIEFPAGKTGNYAIPNSVTSIGGYAFAYCTGLTNITIPNSVTSIGGYAFTYCTGLTSITVPNSVTQIENGAFNNCRGLTGITLPNGITNIPFQTFAICTNLTSITIPNSVISIDIAAFPICTGLTNIVIPNSVTSIGVTAFLNCTALTSIMIPASVTNMGFFAFGGCVNLGGVYFRGNAPSPDRPLFSGNSSAIVYYLPGTTGWGPTFGGRPTALWTPLPPKVGCPAPLILECTNSAAIGTVQAEVMDNSGFPLEVVWMVNGTPYQTNQIPSGGNLTASNVMFMARFESGEHVIEVSAANGYAQPATCTTTVVVVDTLPPRITRIQATPNVLWPPDHSLIPVKVTVADVDNCDPSPVARITQVTSNEPQNPLSPDWEITGPLNLYLQAERLGKGQGRVYTIVVQCKDASGNVSSASVDVTVPHN